MVQIPETFKTGSELDKLGFSNIAEISAERIRLAGKKVLRDSALITDNTVNDVGFRYLSADSSCINTDQRSPDEFNQDMLSTLVDNIKPDRTAEDLLFQVLIDWGLDLSLSVELKILNGFEVFFVDGNSLIACFHKDGDLNAEVISEIANQHPLRVVFRDSGFKDDAMKINVEQIFKSLSPTTEVKTL